jgi:hypothetical protein
MTPATREAQREVVTGEQAAEQSRRADHGSLGSHPNQD